VQGLVVSILKVAPVKTGGLLVERRIEIIEDVFFSVIPRLNLVDRIPPVSIVHEQDAFPECRDLANPLRESAYVESTVDLVLRLLLVATNRPGRLCQDARKAGSVQE
jgi:hypothetical protein